MSLCGKQLVNLLSKPELLAPRTALNIYRALLCETLEALEKNAGVVSQSWHVWSSIKNYIQENIFQSDLSRDNVARVFNLTPSYVSQLFHEFDNQTFNACVTQQRIELAVQLLYSTDKPLKEIAGICGFATPEYFIKVFKKVKGQTPAAFRMQG